MTNIHDLYARLLTNLSKQYNLVFELNLLEDMDAYTGAKTHLLVARTDRIREDLKQEGQKNSRLFAEIEKAT